MKVSHLLYKVDNIDEAVHYFRNLGFSVCYGRKKKPYNALIYFQDRTYIELIQNMNLTKFIEVFLYLIGKRDFVKGLKKMEKMREGFIRFSFHIDKEMIHKIKNICVNEFEEKVSIVNVKRNDVTDNKLSCSCVFPYDSRLPFFNTRLQGNNNLWNVEHPNKIIGINSICYASIGKEYDFIKKFNDENFIKLINEIGGVKSIKFKYVDNSLKKCLVYEDGWKMVNIDKKSEKILEDVK